MRSVVEGRKHVAHWTLDRRTVAASAALAMALGAVALGPNPAQGVAATVTQAEDHMTEDAKAQCFDLIRPAAPSVRPGFFRREGTRRKMWVGFRDTKPESEASPDLVCLGTIAVAIRVKQRDASRPKARSRRGNGKSRSWRPNSRIYRDVRDAQFAPIRNRYYTHKQIVRTFRKFLKWQKVRVLLRKTYTTSDGESVSVIFRYNGRGRWLDAPDTGGPPGNPVR